MQEETSDEETVKKRGRPRKKVKKPEPTDAQWWRCHEAEDKAARAPHRILEKLVQQIEDDQDTRYEAYREYERMYTGTTSLYGHDDALHSLVTGELTQNELANTIETLWAQVYKNRITPTVYTSEADYESWERAKGLSRWLEGVFDEAGVYSDSLPRAGLDSFVYGTGIIKVGWRPDDEDEDIAKITFDRVSPKTVFVDRLEARNGKPRSFFQKEAVDRWVLWDIYKEDSEEFFGSPSERCARIARASACDDKDLGITASTSSKSDLVTVWEVWRKPSGPTAGDGRHVIWIKGCTLVDEPWDDPAPLLFIRFGGRLDGFWGESAVKRLGPTQKLLDKLNKKIDEAQDVMGVPRILVQAGNLPVKEEIDDIPGGILTVKNINGVTDWNATAATQELYAERDNAPRKMRSLLGVSDFEVQQQIPQGMRDVSGAFLERWIDQGQARHAMTHREYEDAVPRLANMAIKAAEEAQEAGYKLVVKSPEGQMRTSIEVLDFEDVCMDRKKYKIRVMPMSDLPATFSGKVEAIEKLKTSAGVTIDPKTALRMVGIPDPNMATDMMVSDEEIIMKNLHFMCKKKTYLSPLPHDNHELIVALTTRFINTYRVKNDNDPDVIAMLSRYIDDALAIGSLGGPDPNAPIDPVAAGPPGPPGAGVPPQLPGM